ncbi:uncharacterized protein G2W53_041078 [Senna tora]|uniref:Uncharacterized protein n=1 Tax=Senna tora TaxID=362788 RepID=A0A834VYG1_9FABA|nr:uncharacterized protein G2W53_041078 [Senna tora]
MCSLQRVHVLATKLATVRNPLLATTLTTASVET